MTNQLTQDQMVKWMADAEKKIEALQIQLTQTTETITAQPSSLPVPTATMAKEPKISLPEKFDGTRSNLRGFMNQLLLLFLANPSRYSSGQQKIALVGSLPTGKALAWVSPRFECRFRRC